MANYAQIRSMDISNGDGVGCSIFVQGCPHHCPNCFNSETWDYNGGKEFTQDIQDKFIETCKVDYIDHVSLLGGEPLAQDTDFYLFIRRIRKEVGKPIWLWTGFLYEELKPLEREVVQTDIDYLIDGRFIQSLYDPNLKYRGSSNQRVIDVKETLKQNKIVTIY